MTTTLTKPTLKIAKKVLDTVDAGLCSGKGKPIPGQMCVEAAVCYAYGLPHSDQPPCVSPALRSFKIALNDKPWSSDAARANGLRRISIAQLGSNKMDDKEFTKRLSEEFIRVFVTQALRSAAKANPKHADKLEACARACEMTGSRQAALDGKEAAHAAYAAYAANAAAYAANAANAAHAAYAAYAAAYAALFLLGFFNHASAASIAFSTLLSFLLCFFQIGRTNLAANTAFLTLSSFVQYHALTTRISDQDSLSFCLWDFPRTCTLASTSS